MIMCIQNLVLFCQLVLKILSKNKILTSIKGRNSVANLRKTKIYNTNLDLVTDNVYTNFGLILSIGLFVSKILSKNSILTSIKGSSSVSNLPKFKLIQAFMHVLRKYDVDQIKNEGARVFTKFLPL